MLLGLNLCYIPSCAFPARPTPGELPMDSSATGDYPVARQRGRSRTCVLRSDVSNPCETVSVPQPGSVNATSLLAAQKRDGRKSILVNGAAHRSMRMLVDQAMAPPEPVRKPTPLIITSSQLSRCVMFAQRRSILTWNSQPHILRTDDDSVADSVELMPRHRFELGTQSVPSSSLNDDSKQAEEALQRPTGPATPSSPRAAVMRPTPLALSIHRQQHRHNSGTPLTRLAREGRASGSTIPHARGSYKSGPGTPLTPGTARSKRRIAATSGRVHDQRASRHVLGLGLTPSQTDFSNGATAPDLHQVLPEDADDSGDEVHRRPSMMRVPHTLLLVSLLACLFPCNVQGGAAAQSFQSNAQREDVRLFVSAALLRMLLYRLSLKSIIDGCS